MGGNPRRQLRALVSVTALALTGGLMVVGAGLGASPAEAATCVVSVQPKTITRYTSTSALSRTAYRTATVVRRYSSKAQAVGRARHRFTVDAVATTTLTVTTCVLGLEVPVEVSARRQIRSPQWAAGRRAAWGYGADRITEAKSKAMRRASAQARVRATSQGRRMARSAAHAKALVKAVDLGLLPGNAAYTDAVEQAWLTLANDVRVNRKLPRVRTKKVFEPLAADWARTVHDDYLARYQNGTIHDTGFMKDLAVSGCSSSFIGGEVIAQMYRYDDPWRSAILVRNSWLKSPSHRAVLLDRRFKLAGAGGYTSGSWVTLVGRYRSGSCSSWVS